MKLTVATRIMLIAVLSAGVGIVGEMSPAFAHSTRSNPTSVVEKAKRKKKATVKIADSSLGQILVNSEGRTLYSFDPDGTNVDASACTGQCASTWPPLTAEGKPKAGKGLKAALLAVGVGGQVAYNNHLLYTFTGDSQPGQANGNGLGGVWHALGPDGNAIP